MAWERLKQDKMFESTVSLCQFATSLRLSSFPLGSQTCMSTTRRSAHLPPSLWVTFPSEEHLQQEGPVPLAGGKKGLWHLYPESSCRDKIPAWRECSMKRLKKACNGQSWKSDCFLVKSMYVPIPVTQAILPLFMVAKGCCGPYLLRNSSLLPGSPLPSSPKLACTTLCSQNLSCALIQEFGLKALFCNWIYSKGVLINGKEGIVDKKPPSMLVSVISLIPLSNPSVNHVIEL